MIRKLLVRWDLVQKRGTVGCCTHNPTHQPEHTHRHGGGKTMRNAPLPPPIKTLSPFVTGPGDGLLWMCGEIRARLRFPPGAAVRHTGTQPVRGKSTVRHSLRTRLPYLR